MGLHGPSYHHTIPKDLKVSMVMASIWHWIIIGGNLVNKCIPWISLMIYGLIGITPVLGLLA